MNVAEMDNSVLRVAALLVPDFSNLTLGGVIEPLRVVNRVEQREVVRWQLIAEVPGIVLSSSGIPIKIETELAAADPFDVLFVLASDNAERVFSPALARFLRRAAREGRTICAFDSAPLLLARAGLLDGKRATTHWEDLEEFEARFPRVHVVPVRFVTDGRISTTSGSQPSHDFAMEFLQRRVGLATALSVASLFQYDGSPVGSEPQQMVASSQFKTRSRVVLAAVAIMEQNIANALTLEQIAASISSNTKQLHRQFRRETGSSPGRFYRSLRLNVARRLLETTSRTTVDIAVSCGFESRSSFSRAFSELFHRSPAAVRRANRP